MRYFKYILLLLFILSVNVEAQIRGRGETWTKGEIQDSLHLRPDTTDTGLHIATDSTIMDSILRVRRLHVGATGGIGSEATFAGSVDFQAQINVDDSLTVGDGDFVASNDSVYTGVVFDAGAGFNAHGTFKYKDVTLVPTFTELNFVDGLTSSAQDQIDAKAATSGWTASRAMQTSGAGALEASATTATELGYIDGLESNAQAQLNATADTSDIGKLMNNGVLDALDIDTVTSADRKGIQVGKLSDSGDFYVYIRDTKILTTSTDSLPGLVFSAVTNQDTMNYIYADTLGIIRVNASGWPGGEEDDSQHVHLATVVTRNDSVVAIISDYTKQDHVIVDHEEYLSAIAHNVVHTGLVVSEGTGSNLGFDLSAGDVHNVHGSHFSISADADFDYLDIVEDDWESTITNTTYGNGSTLTANYYTRFLVWILLSEYSTTPQMRVSRDASQYGGVDLALAAPDLTIPSNFDETGQRLLQVTFKKSKTWDNLSTTKDWITKDMRSVFGTGGAAGGGIGSTDIAAMIHDSLDVEFGTDRENGNYEMVGASNIDTLHPIRDMKYAEGLSLDLDYYFARSVVDIACKTTDYASWTDKRWDDGADGTHGDDATNYKTDAQGISLSAADANTDGMYIDFTDLNLALFSDGDTSVAADYICIAVYILTQDITDLNDADGLVIALTCDTQGTLTNYYSYAIDDATLSNGWNYIKVAKSGFTENGTGTWNSIKGFTLWVVTPDADVTLTIDNIQMVRKDAGAAKPNPFQRETASGTWKNEWTQEGNGNFWIVKESGRLAMMCAEATQQSYIKAVSSFGDYKASGSILVGHVNYPGIWEWELNLLAQLISQKVQLYNSAVTQDVTFAYAAGDVIYYRATRNGTVAGVAVSKDGINWTSNSMTFTGMTNPSQPIVRTYGTTQRVYSFALSTVEHAHHATVADGVSGLGGSTVVFDSLWQRVSVKDTMQLSGTGEATVTNDGAHGYVVNVTAGGSPFKESTITIGPNNADVGVSRYHMNDSLMKAFGMCADSVAAWGGGTARLTLQTAIYRTNETIEIDDAGRVIFDGGGSTLITTGATLWTFTGVKSGARLDMRDLTVIGTGGADGFIALNEETNIDLWEFKGIEVRGMDNGVFSLDTLAEGWIIRGCRFVANSCVNFFARSGTIENCRFDSVSGDNVLKVLALNNIVRENVFEWCFPDAGEGMIVLSDWNINLGFRFYGGEVTGNTLWIAPRDSVAGYGIFLNCEDNDMNAPIVSGNKILAGRDGNAGNPNAGAISYGIYVNTVSREGARITGNTITGAAVAGIYLTGSSYTHISGNTLIGIKPTGAIGVHLSTSSYSFVTGNYLYHWTLGVDDDGTKNATCENYFMTCTADTDVVGATNETVDDSRTD